MGVRILQMREPMNIIQRAQSFVQELRELGNRSDQEWRRCPKCGCTRTIKHGYYMRHPWRFSGRADVAVQRYRCPDCGKTYSEKSPLLVPGSWYAREVHRCAIDHWMHGGMSLRRVAEMLRSWMGRQERWLKWLPLDVGPRIESMCWLCESTVHRWLDRAGVEAERTVAGQLEGIECSGLRVLRRDGHGRAVGTITRRREAGGAGVSGQRERGDLATGGGEG